MKTQPTLVAASLAAALCLGASAALASTHPGQPLTSKNRVTDEYHGVKVTDDYRWLENWDDPRVQKWNAAQNTYTRSILDKLPHREDIRHRLEDLEKSPTVSYSGMHEDGGLLFALKTQPPRQQPFLVALKSPEAPLGERVLVDPNKINPKGTTAIDYFQPTHDGKLVAVSLSENGSEDGDLHLYEVATGKALKDVIPHFAYPTAGGWMAWNADASGFWYTRYPRPGERPEADAHFFQQVWFHKLGRPLHEDTYVIGKDFPRIAEIEMSTSKDGRYLLVNCFNGDGGEHAFHLLGPAGKWTQVTRFQDKIIQAEFGPGGALFLLSHLDAPRGKVLKVQLEDPSLAKAVVVVPPSEPAIETITLTDHYLFAQDIVGGPEQVRAFDASGKPLGSAPIPDISSVGGVVAWKGDQVLVETASYTQPAAWYRFQPESKEWKKTSLFLTSPVDFSDCEVRRIFATSKDGTKVPVNILMKKGLKLDGKNPTLLYAYGGYGLSQTPSFRGNRRAWIEQGGIYAVANIRGGGEYGEEWHTQGNLTHKQSNYDDFIACSEALIKEGYTSKAHLAIEGGSNGGLLMGAVMTQRPDLFRAVISHVGVYDMLRVEDTPNGAFNVTEYGTVKDPAQFKALLGYSPYHNVHDGTAYPSTMLLAGQHDGRVEPFMSRKFAARLQAGNGGPNPVLLRTSAHSGHGIGSSLDERVGQDVDVNSFLFDALKVDYKLTQKKVRKG